jgi:hypothetical protein
MLGGIVESLGDVSGGGLVHEMDPEQVGIGGP